MNNVATVIRNRPSPRIANPNSLSRKEIFEAKSLAGEVFLECGTQVGIDVEQIGELGRVLPCPRPVVENDGNDQRGRGRGSSLEPRIPDAELVAQQTQGDQSLGGTLVLEQQVDEDLPAREWDPEQEVAVALAEHCRSWMVVRFIRSGPCLKVRTQSIRPQ